MFISRLHQGEDNEVRCVNHKANNSETLSLFMLLHTHLHKHWAEAFSALQKSEDNASLSSAPRPHLKMGNYPETLTFSHAVKCRVLAFTSTIFLSIIP